MVDGVKTNGSARPTPVVPVAAVKTPVADAPRAETKAAAPAAAPSIGSLARTLAATPPVDKDRVAQIKRAIQTGTFPILPATIADRLLALKLEWSGRDEA